MWQNQTRSRRVVTEGALIARVKEQKGWILHFEAAKVRLKEQKGLILHFGAAKVRQKERKGWILHFGSKPGSASNDCAIHFCKS